ncbi:MAG: hypothetical protein IJ583_11125, partial [Firmicutes bacterium]|nr:hypothetical protein [Bacillota bacterium]
IFLHFFLQIYFVVFCHILCYNFIVAAYDTPATEEVMQMVHWLFDFVMSVLAGIVTYYICKSLDN